MECVPKHWLVAKQRLAVGHAKPNCVFGGPQRVSSRQRWQVPNAVPLVEEGSRSEQEASKTGSPEAALQQRLGGGAQAGPSSQLEPTIEPSKFQALLAEGMRQLTGDEIVSAFEFPLDDFQREAVDAYLEGHSVVVCAPTGAGKTAIAQAATTAVLARGGRVIYTTPLKALSNQKLQEMRALFGTDRVGLQTGDANLNAEGDIVVMTTEVLRNILFRSGSGTADDRMRAVGLVVLDEVHYLADPDRGSVWEEVIISCPDRVPLLCMSATVRNPDDLGGWITKVHGSCRTIVTDFRPVPLHWSFCHADDVTARLTPLLGDDGGLHPALGGDSEAAGTQRGFGVQPQRRRRRFADARPETPHLKAPSTEEALVAISAAGWLPAIWFVFSRKGCDAAVLRMHAQGVVLTNHTQQEAIARAIAELKLEQPEAIRDVMLDPLLNGVASHHAGCLPAWKGLIEELFRQGCIQVVFATGTLAAGINMPARSAVISSTTRREGSNHKLLSHNELLQMAGRAGRRGFDTEGHCVLLQDRFGEPQDAVGLLKKGPEPLRSHFSTGYGMVLKLLAFRSLSSARKFVQRSFYNYLADEGVKAREKAIAAVEEEAAQMLYRALKAEEAAGGAAVPYKKYLELKRAYQKARQEVRTAARAATRSRGRRAKQILETLPLPALVAVEFRTLDSVVETEAQLALLVSATPVGSEDSGSESEAEDQQIQYLCLTADNRLFQSQAKHFAALSTKPSPFTEAEQNVVVGAANSLKNWVHAKSGSYIAEGSARTARIAAKINSIQPQSVGLQPVEPRAEAADRAAAAQQLMEETKAAAEDAQHRASRAKNQREDLRLRAEATRLKRKARDLKASLEARTAQKEYTWKSFESSLQVLIKAGALESGSLQATPLGQVARELNGENELWLAIVLTHSALEGLRPAEMAAVVSAMVMTEVLVRPGIMVQYTCSDAVLAAVEAMEKEREQLFYLQADAGVDASLVVDVRLAGVVEAWASGATWEQIMADCSLDGGDIARMLSRTMDVLRQAVHCEALPPDTRTAMRRAMKAMARNPIIELVQ